MTQGCTLQYTLNASELRPDRAKKCANPARLARRPAKTSSNRPKRLKRGSKMPLVKSASKEAFRKNVKAEVKSGKPVKQAVAIAYATKRAAAKPAKKMK